MGILYHGLTYNRTDAFVKQLFLVGAAAAAAAVVIMVEALFFVPPCRTSKQSY
jgi:hypothetical protein